MYNTETPHRQYTLSSPSSLSLSVYTYSAGGKYILDNPGKGWGAGCRRINKSWQRNTCSHTRACTHNPPASGDAPTDGVISPLSGDD